MLYTVIRNQEELLALVDLLLRNTTINTWDGLREKIDLNNLPFIPFGRLFLHADGTIGTIHFGLSNYKRLTLEQFYEKALELFPNKKEKNKREKADYRCNKCQFYFHEKEHHYVEGELKFVGDDLCRSAPQIVDISNRNKKACAKFKKMETR